MLVLLLLLSALPAWGLRSPLGRRYPTDGGRRAPPAAAGDGPLFLTPLIESGELEKARNLSKVVGISGYAYESHSGYLTVNKEHNSNLFFWFIEAKENADSAPVLLWLQGGPGASSLYAMFVENGPYSIDADLNLVPRNLTWVNTHNVLYIDNPVGTGFSFTDDDEGYAKNQDDVARDLYSGLVQFFTIFERFQTNDFYVTGESYAGKYVPAISYKIHQENPKADLKINMKGMAIGDGLVDPINMLNYGDLLYSIGLVDANQKEFFTQKAEETAQLITQGDFMGAFNAWDVVVNGDKTPYPTYYHNVTGFVNYFNYLFPIDPNDPSTNPYNDFLNLPSTREAIHVGDRPYNDGQPVEDHLLNDIMNSSKSMVEGVLDGGYRVMIYNGQLDVIIAYTLTEQWLATAKWHGAEQYKNAERLIWRVDNEIAGYVRVADNLHEVMVRNAGHMLPTDQPEWAYALINMFTMPDGPKWRQ
ncbi:venom serine carboxypeptidase-like isoform X2 [Pollicipes pollicipes]|nr:venom serine carboxypeptidase-like isoform X2 [Pollicipes pollicipes]